MIAIKPKAKALLRCNPNILPCRIDHNGPVNTCERYWAPTIEEDGRRTAYFRGRMLHGSAVKIPEGYRGAVMIMSEKDLSSSAHQNDSISASLDKVLVAESDEDDEQSEATRVFEENASFDEIVVWGHEAIPERDNDPYIKGLDEWIAFAETMHSYPSSSRTTKNDEKRV